MLRRRGKEPDLPEATIEVAVEKDGVVAPFRVHRGTVSIGRDDSCDVRIREAVVSREHAVLRYVGGSWWIEDRNSTNGLYESGRRVQRSRIEGSSRFRLGEDGPVLHVRAEGAEGPMGEVDGGRRLHDGDSRGYGSASPRRSQGRPGGVAAAPGGRATAGPGRRAPNDDRSPVESAGRRERQTDYDAGMQTLAVEAYVGTLQRRYLMVIAAVVVICLGAVVLALVFQLQNDQLRERMAMFEIREIDRELARMRMIADEARPGLDLEREIERLQELRRRKQSAYDVLVRDFGFLRRPDEEEQRIFAVARVFNESRSRLSGEFLRLVKDKIHNYWLTPAGRGRFERAVERAERGDHTGSYTPYIVETFQRYGLPPQFFYLALQESNFDTGALGPYSHPRFGRAKGMWQFIPETARRFGLTVPQYGENEDRVVVGDERHEFERSTRAAAEYLTEIYATLTYASGLLAVASYNWGEQRVVNKMENMLAPEEIGEILDGLPDDPDARGFWKFYGSNADRMPEQTKDYVFKIVAAAAIGEDPRAYGFDFDNPLLPYTDP